MLKGHEVGFGQRFDWNDNIYTFFTAEKGEDREVILFLKKKK